jgi:hypothetical protein
MKKHFIFTGFIILLGLSNLFSQEYKGGIGLRAGLPFGITGKYFIAKESALEGILHTDRGGFGFTGLYEKHQPLGNVEGFFFFYGAGAGIYFPNNTNGGTSIGIDGVIGLEYVVPAVPISIGIDFKPYLRVVPNFYIGNETMQGALSVRYIFR